jgi:hypothetical protein
MTFEMKLHMENLEQKCEYNNKLKNENRILNEKLKKMEDSKKDNEIFILKSENKNMKELLAKKEKNYEIKEKEFMDKIIDLNKKLNYYEENYSKYQNSKILIDSENDRSVSKFNQINKFNNIYFIIFFFTNFIIFSLFSI